MKKNMTPRRRANPVTTVALLSASLLAAGCAIHPEPLTPEENLARVRKDLSVVLAPQEPIAKPITMQEAMARAIKYNLDERVKLMEEAVATQQLDLAHYDMLPRVVAGAGYTGRNNDAGSESLNLVTGRRTGESTTATDRHRRTADLGFTWNILDFGVSYLRAHQSANLVLIAEERRRRVVQGILQDVRTAYWRAVAAERLLARIAPLEKRVEGARRDARSIEAMRVQAPLQALTYTRTLVETLRQLQSLRRELVIAKSQLAALMGLPPGEPFTLELPPVSVLKKPPTLTVPVQALETYALLNRPELLEESYNQRISADETWRSLLKLLPGIDLNAGLHYDSNSFVLNQRWMDYGARVSWNLINIVSAPDTLAYGQAQEELITFRRQALSVAVLSQVQVAMIQFRELSQEYALTTDQADIDTRIEAQYANAGSAGQGGELGVIQAEVSSLLSDLRRDLVFADLHNAYARVMVSAGVDPLPDAVPSADLATLTAAVNKGLDTWQERANSALRVRDLATKEAPKSEAAKPDATPSAEKPAAPAVPVAEAIPAAPIKTAAITATPLAPASASVPAATPNAVAAPVTPAAAPVPVGAKAGPVVLTAQPIVARAQAPAATGPVVTATQSPVIQADLGAYTSHKLAQRDWDMIAKRLGPVAAGKGALFVTSRRSGDGKTIVQLRVGGFSDHAAAERFCQDVKDKQQECTVRSVSALEGLPADSTVAAL